MDNDRISNSKISVIYSGLISDVAATKLMTECDVGTARNGVLIISCSGIGNTSDISDITVYTDVGGTITSDHRVATITKAEYYRTDAKTTRTAITVTDNEFTIPCDSSDLVVIAQVMDLERYVNVAYKCTAGVTDTYQLEVLLVTYDSEESPFTGARTNY